MKPKKEPKPIRYEWVLDKDGQWKLVKKPKKVEKVCFR